MERCRRCGSLLTFVGFDRYGKRVLSCTASLGVKREDGAMDSALCNLKGEWVIGDKAFGQVNWMARKDDERKSSGSWGRCRDHGQEWASMASRQAD